MEEKFYKNNLQADLTGKRLLDLSSRVRVLPVEGFKSLELSARDPVSRFLLLHCSYLKDVLVVVLG